MPYSLYLDKILLFRDKLFGIAMVMLRDRQESEDAVQEVYLKMWKHRKRVSTYDNPETFAIRVLKNLCIDKLRAGKTKSASHWLGLDPTEPVTPYHILAHEELFGKIEAIIKVLPELEMKVIRLRHGEQKSSAEIAKILDITPNHVRVLLSRARKQIKEQLKKRSYYGS